MNKKLIPIVLLLTVGLCKSSHIKAQVNVQDSLALVDFYNSTGGPTWNYNRDWLSYYPVEFWFGVTVMDNRVVAINMSEPPAPPDPDCGEDDGCPGVIPTWGDHWDGNNLTGNLPSSITKLTALKILNLTGARITGNIPVLNGLESLEHLGLSSNLLTGSIPASIGSLSKLRGLVLSNNNLTGGIPASIGNLDSLRVLDLSFCPLGGTIPTSLGNLDSLVFLYLDNCNLTGSIPSTLNNLTVLEYLYMRNNILSGAIPSAMFSSLVKLRYAFLSNNQLSGTIPAFSKNLVLLNYIDLRNNQFSGAIPASAGNLPGLWYLYLSNNKLSGTIPSNLGNGITIRELLLDHNQLSGQVPDMFNNFIGLQILKLGYNQLTSPLPNSLLYGGKVSSASIEHNKLTGDLSFLRKTKLGSVNLSYNQLTGALPDTIGTVYDNGSIFGSSLDLSHNQLTGMVPKSIQKMTNLGLLRLNNNNLSGPIPSLSALTHLSTLVLSNNRFTYDAIELLGKENSIAKYVPQANIELHFKNGDLSTYAGGTLMQNTYYWFRNGSMYKIIKADSIFTPTLSGSYYVRVKNNYAPKITLQSTTVTINEGSLRQAALLASQQLNGASLGVYPNPVRSSATVLFTTSGNYRLIVTDSYGKTLQAKSGTAYKQQVNVNINVSAYIPGTYFITLTDEKGKKHYAKLIKE